MVILWPRRPLIGWSVEFAIHLKWSEEWAVDSTWSHCVLLSRASRCVLRRINWDQFTSLNRTMYYHHPVSCDWFCKKKNMLLGSCCTNTKLTFLQRYGTCEKGHFFCLRCHVSTPPSCFGLSVNFCLLKAGSNLLKRWNKFILVI